MFRQAFCAAPDDWRRELDPGLRSPTSSRENMLAVLHGREPGERVVTPLVDRWAPLVLGKRILRGDPVNDQLQAAGRCGYDPLIVEYGFDWGKYLPSLRWNEAWHETNERLYLTKTLFTPVGAVHTVVVEANDADWVAEPPIKRLEDYAVLEWMQAEFLSHPEEMKATIQDQVKRARRLIGDRGLYYVTTGFGIGPSAEDAIYHAHDCPEVAERVGRTSEKINRLIIKTAIQAGVDLVFLSDPPAGYKSNRKWMAEDAPRLRQTVDFVHACGGYALVHDCTRIHELVQLGGYNLVKPDVLETFAPPPTGDIMDLRWARQQVDPEITTKGNLDVGLLREGTRDEVARATLNIIEATAGYRHWVGTGDAVLGGTPIENVRAMVEAAKGPVPMQA